MAGLKRLTFIYTIDKDMNNTACVLSCNAYVLTTQHTRASGVENKNLNSTQCINATNLQLKMKDLRLQTVRMVQVWNRFEPPRKQACVFQIYIYIFIYLFKYMVYNVVPSICIN